MKLGNLPVFPLKTITFPGHKIPLKVFEDRYLQMLKDIEQKRCFVISLISSGEEVGGVATPYRVGTLVEVDTIQRKGDFHLIKPCGLHRVYLDAFDRESKPYLMAACSMYVDEENSPELIARLTELEKKILERVAKLGPEESLGIHEVLEDLRHDLDPENYSLFLCGCLHLPTIYLQRLLESKSMAYRIDNALNLLSQPQ